MKGKNFETTKDDLTLFQDLFHSNAIRFCVTMQYHLFSMTDADQGPLTEA